VNNAANPLHLEQLLADAGQVVRYKVAWIGGANVLYDRAKLQSIGGFSWWHRLPPEHAGEEVVVQFLLSDVSDAEAVFKTVQFVVERFGRLDFVVNCAAIDHTLPVDEMTIRQ
jgi:NAD(P)-dependent dehydrogenase (short-subunit alcohol dehydrogenase family)